MIRVRERLSRVAPLSLTIPGIRKCREKIDIIDTINSDKETMNQVAISAYQGDIFVGDCFFNRLKISNFVIDCRRMV